jgi:hypothetical protein
MAGQARATLNADLKRAEAVGPGIRVTMDGTAYTVHVGEISARLGLALRKQSGMSWNELMAALGDGYDLDLVAIVVWLARVVGGEDIPLDAVLDSIMLNTQATVDGVPATSTPTDPVVRDGEAVSPNA